MRFCLFFRSKDVNRRIMNYEVSIVRYYRTDIREHVCRSVSIIVTLYNELEMRRIGKQWQIFGSVGNSIKIIFHF